MLAFKKLRSPLGKACSWVRARGSHPNGWEWRESFHWFVEIGISEQEKNSRAFSEPAKKWSLMANCRHIQGLPHGFVWMIPNVRWMTQMYRHIRQYWVPGKKGRGGKWGEQPTVTFFFFFYLLESKIIFTENVVGYYNLEGDHCNLPVGNSLKRRAGFWPACSYFLVQELLNPSIFLF